MLSFKVWHELRAPLAAGVGPAAAGGWLLWVGVLPGGSPVSKIFDFFTVPQLSSLMGPFSA